MKVIVRAVEFKKTFRTYSVDGVESLDEARKCVLKLYNNQQQRNAYQMQEYQAKPYLTIDRYEVVED